ncbi:insulinase family protein [Mucilaginibacter sp. HMF5004]|uniref:M16 family metallopeptidase n=1 Tax=Mucilaginibacter rivuli TaxID=2857527 RepID=UPI001C5F9914|nr:pitrilysin family protein [Mucilaginibacter rivuli]MBW4890494.1 insulinase family protein [Mucilaginibacter rivuli]
MKKYIMILAGACLMQFAQAQNIDRSHPPKPGPAPVLTIKDPVIYKLSNGITILVVEDHRLPKVSATYNIDAGPRLEGSKAGVISLMGDMLNEGTKTLPKAAFDDAVEKMGANVSLNASGGSASALTRYFKTAFSLMGQALKEPAFTQESFDKLKVQTLTSIKNSAKSAPAIASRITNALAYGKDHPNGEFETEETVKALTIQDIKDAYASYITPSRAYITIVGDIKPLEAKALVTEVFGTWKGKILTVPKFATVNNPSTTEIDVVNVPSAVQSEIKVVNLVDLKKNDPDLFPVLLANYILGGGAESRLFMNLREKHGFTYGAYSSTGSGRWQSLFNASASVRNAKADSAIMEFLKEIKRIRTEKVSAEELANAKALYAGSFALGLEDPARTATFASNIILNDLPADFYKTYLQKVNAVTADDILRVAQKYFSAGNSRITVAGNTAQMLDGIKKIGLPVKMYDAYASPVTDAPKTTGSAMMVQAVDVVKDFLKAAGGADELKKVNTYYAAMNMSMQGMALSATQKQMVPNKEAMAVSMGPNVMFKTVFDGEKGYQMQGGAQKPMTADEIASKKFHTALIDQLDYISNPAFKLEIKGIQKVGEGDAYQVQVTDPTGKVSTDYYDIKSKFLVRHEGTTGTQTQTIDLSDYRKVGTVMFPYKLVTTIAAGGQEQTYTMTVADLKLNSGVTADDFK